MNGLWVEMERVRDIAELYRDIETVSQTLTHDAHSIKLIVFNILTNYTTLSLCLSLSVALCVFWFVMFRYFILFFLFFFVLFNLTIE